MNEDAIRTKKIVKQLGECLRQKKKKQQLGL